MCSYIANVTQFRYAEKQTLNWYMSTDEAKETGHQL
jgi:hypothetical protein